MKTERELFELEARKYEDCDLSKNEDGSYKSDLTHTCFYWWCKSAQREGYKILPVEIIDAIDWHTKHRKYGRIFPSYHHAE